MDRVQQFARKFTADHGPYLDDLFGRPEPVQPRHQRVMQGDRDLTPREPRIATLEHRPRQLLDEEWYPAGALDHYRDGLLRQGLLGRYFPHHRAHVTRTQPVERDLRVMRP